MSGDFLITQIIHLATTVPDYSTWPDCIIGQISWNSGGRILIKKSSFWNRGGRITNLKIISEDYYKNITNIDLEFNVQLSTSIYIDCIASLFNLLFKWQIIGFSSLGTVGALWTDLSEFQGQNFKVGGTLGAELVCFCIQGKMRPPHHFCRKMRPPPPIL